MQPPVISFHTIPPAQSLLRDRTKLRHFLRSLARSEQLELGSLDIIFCSDKYLLEINREFLAHDYYTDIITFNLAEPGQPVVGELYISTDRVRANASSHQVSIKTELHRVIFHGLLHLAGYADKTKKDIEEIRARENKYLKAYFS